MWGALEEDTDDDDDNEDADDGDYNGDDVDENGMMMMTSMGSLYPCTSVCRGFGTHTDLKI